MIWKHGNSFVRGPCVSLSGLHAGAQNKHMSSNAERDAEKKKEQEAWEKKVGILQYLGQTVSDREGGKPWYEQAPGAAAAVTATTIAKHEFQQAQQAELDPVTAMQVRVLDRGREAEGGARGRGGIRFV